MFVSLRRRGRSSLVGMDKDHILTKAVPVEWAAALDRWELYLRAGGRSERTVETRIRHVRQVARGLGVVSPRDVDTDMLMRYLGRQRWAAETRHGYYESLRLFYRWLYPKGGSPAEWLPVVPRHPGAPRPVPLDVLHEAVAAADRRTRLILCLGACAGLRASDIAAVHGRDVLDDGTGVSLMVTGKGGRVRRVPLADWLARAVVAACSAGAAGVSHRSTAGICRARMSRSSRPSCYGMGGLSTRCGIGSRQPRIRPSGICWRSNDCWGMRAWRQRSVMRPLPRMPCAGRSRPPISPVRRE